jgi:YbbR domain-containing protein
LRKEDGVLRNNKLNLLISIVCAVVLWAYITTVVNPITERTVNSIPVELVNLDALNDRGFTVSEGIPAFVDVTVSGARSEVTNLTPADFRATADIAGYRKGVAKVPINISGPVNIEIIQLRPEDTIDIEVVDLITVFKPVRLEFEEEFPPGTEPGFIQVIPEEMEVTGVAEVVDNIDYVRVPVPEGVLTEELTTNRLEVEVVDRNGNVVYNIGLSQSSVEFTGMLCTVKRVPLDIEIIGQPNESVEVTDMYIPTFVSIRGAAEVVEGITEAKGRPVDVSEITSTTEISLLDILGPGLPEGVEIAEASINGSIKIEVQGIQRKEFRFTADMIEIVNLLPSLSGHVNTGSVKVTILATREILAMVNEADIHLTVDASDLRWAANLIEMDVDVVSDIEVKEIIVEPRKVRITIVRE